MTYINLTLENIDKEHLCCALADKKHQVGVDMKKEWIKDRIKEGHTFRKLDAKGKVFIEFAPLDKSWVPVVGDDYYYIYCLWVAGSYQNQSHGKDLLEYAIQQAKGHKGICTITSKKKKPFVSEKKFFLKYGFKVVDTIGDYELLALSFDGSNPSFNATARRMKIEDQTTTIYYSPQCPYVNNCINEIKEYCQETKTTINCIKVDSLEIAKNMPCVFNNWATFINGEFVSNTLLNKNSLEKLLERK